MRAGWEQTTLGEAVTFKGGGTPSTEKPSYWNGEIPWVSPKDMKSSEVGDSIDKITPEAIDNSAASLIPKDAILIVVRSGILARTIPVGITTRPLAVNQDIKALCPGKGLDPLYLHYFMQASEPDILKLVTRGATVHRLSTDSLKALQFPKPPLSEQQRIVAILDEAFAGLATATANAEKNLKNARELFESYVDSIFEQRETWENTTLGEIAEFKNGLNFTKSSKGEKIRIVGVKDFQNHFWVPMDELESAQIDGGLSEAYLLRKNDILTVRSNGNKQLIGRCILAGNVSGKVSHSGFTIRIRIVRAGVDPVYLVRYLKSGAVRRALIESGDGAQISNLNQQALTALPIVLPTMQKQEGVTASLAELEAEAAKLEGRYVQKIADLAELKQSILQKAFSGELTSPPSQAIQEAAE